MFGDCQRITRYTVLKLQSWYLEASYNLFGLICKEIHFVLEKVVSYHGFLPHISLQGWMVVIFGRPLIACLRAKSWVRQSDNIRTKIDTETSAKQF